MKNIIYRIISFIFLNIIIAPLTYYIITLDAPTFIIIWYFFMITFISLVITAKLIDIEFYL